MAGATLTTISNILKNFYLGPVQNQLNSKVLALQLLQVSSENLEGLQAVLPLHTSRTSGIGSRGELEALPVSGAQAYAQAVYDLKYHYGRVQVSGQAISKSASGAGSFLRAMQSELDYIKDDLAVDFARQVYGDGTGQIAQCGVTTASATVVLASAEQIRKGFLYIGMVVSIGTAAAPNSLVDGIASPTNGTIIDVNLTTPSITVGTAITTSAANFVTRAGNVLAGPVIKEMDAGLMKILATAANSVGGINAASAGNSYWDNLRDTSGGAISLSAMLSNWNLANANGADADQIVALTTPGLVRRLFETADFKTNVRFVNSEKMAGGFSSVSFNTGGGDVQLVSDRHFPYGNVTFVDKARIRLFSPADWDFLQKDGLTVRQVAGFDAYEAILFRYANMGTDRRNTSVRVSGLTDTNGA